MYMYMLYIDSAELANNTNYIVYDHTCIYIRFKLKWFIGKEMIIANKLSICNVMLPLQSKENKRFVFKSVLIFVCNGIQKIVLHYDIKENPSEDSPI